MGKVMVITGATGYLGQRIVLYAQQRGHKVIAVVRPGRDITSMPWAAFDDIDIVEVDLASDLALTALQESLSGVDQEAAVVIHAAGSLVGNEDVQRAQTVKPTERLMRAMMQTGLRRLVFLSSMSVYGYSALPENSQLDETTPAEPYKDQRDAYCRAKLSQESILLKAAQLHGFVVTALRPGAIIGPDRLLTSRLGVIKSSMGFQLGRNAKLPISFVEHCAEAVILAAEQDTINSDVYVESDDFGSCGAFEAINVLDDKLPTQQEYINMLKKHTDIWPAFYIYIPWNVMKLAASLLSVIAMAWSGLLTKLPGVLREASLHARIKPLRYNNARLHDRLGWTSKLDCEDVIRQSEHNIP